MKNNSLVESRRNHLLCAMFLTQNRHAVRVDNVLPSLIAVGPSANKATTERVMATSVILFILTSMALRCVLPKGSHGGPVISTEDRNQRKAGIQYTVPQLASIISHFPGAFHRTQSMHKTRMIVQICNTKQPATDFVENRQKR